MLLDQLLDDVEVIEVRGDPATVVLDVTHDSAAVRPGSLFCCVPGAKVDGHDFAETAVKNGASALLVERALPVGAAQVIVSDARASMAPVAAAFWGHPSRKLTVVGTTGTNGKTTTTLLVAGCLEADGRRTESIGTMSGGRTTPEATDLQATLAAFVDEGGDAVAMEVSSVGLAQHRVDAVHFAAVVFTNLAPDEMAFHGSLDAYFAAKASLFERHRAEVAVINRDDEYGRRLIAMTDLPVREYSLADAQRLELEPGRARFSWEGHDVRLQLDGRHNVANALAAATACRELGVRPQVIADALSQFTGIAGHGEPIDEGQPFRVMVDYAHTGAALDAALASARAATPSGRVIVVFGCGGDRDPHRRPLMGAAASSGADVAVVTSDNPRHEDPMAIIDAILRAMDGPAEVIVEPDRRAAIARALDEAGSGDTVLIAGKGHETGQVVGEITVPFDDRQVARQLLRQRAS